MRKYELTNDTIETREGTVLRRIMAIVDLPHAGVRAGDFGGYLEAERNLSHTGQSWVGDRARVLGHARVEDDALVLNLARVAGNAHIFEGAEVTHQARVDGFAAVRGTAQLRDWAGLSGGALLEGSAQMYGQAKASDSAVIGGEAEVYGDAVVAMRGQVTGDVHLLGNAIVVGSTTIDSGEFHAGRALLAIGTADGSSKGLADVDGVLYIGSGGEWLSLAEAREHWAYRSDRKASLELLEAARVFAAAFGLRSE